MKEEFEPLNIDKMTESFSKLFNQVFEEKMSNINTTININADGTQAIEEAKQTADTVENIIDETDTTFRPDVDDTKLKTKLKKTIDYSLSLKDLINLKSSELSTSEIKQIDNFIASINNTVNKAIENIDISTLSDLISNTYSNGPDKEFVANFSLAKVLNTKDYHVDDYLNKFEELTSGSSKTSNRYKHIADMINEQSDIVVQTMMDNATADLERVNTIYTEEGTKAVISYFNAVKVALDKNYTNFDSNKFFSLTDDPSSIRDKADMEIYLAEDRLRDLSSIANDLWLFDIIPEDINNACHEYVRLLSLAREFKADAEITDDDIGYERSTQQAERALEAGKKLQAKLEQVGATFELPGIDELYEIVGNEKQANIIEKISDANDRSAKAAKENAQASNDTASANERAAAAAIEEANAKEKAANTDSDWEYAKFLSQTYSDADKTLEYDRQKLEAEKQLNAERQRGLKQIAEYNRTQEKAAAAAVKSKEKIASLEAKMQEKAVASQIKQISKAVESSINLNSLVDSNGKIPQYASQIDKLKNEFVNAGRVIGMTNDEIHKFISDLNPSELNNYQQEVAQLTQRLKTLNSNDLFSQSGKFGDYKGTFDRIDDAKKAVEQLASEYKSFTDIIFKDPNPNDGISQFTTNVTTATGESKKLVATYSNGALHTKITQAAKATSSWEKIIGSLSSKWQNVIGYVFSFGSFYKILDTAKQGFGIIHNLDDAYTEMRKVSEESTSSLKEYQRESFNTADAVGTTSKAIQDSTASWMRLGESLDDAKQSAKDATILLNVSEFEDIDSATESLVAMSQAYQEFSKIEIIDKLNNIGNNYSIATNDLASSLQRSAATLKIAGNTLDEAIALTTAGNSILQDPDSVGAGLKTISLRILGTEEAKAELEALGEDVSDFVVQTQSKLDEQVRHFTATELNKDGISLLDDNGNYKSTYQILRDISDVYQEILDTDKQFGTNRGQALVELLAGKNRANILSSILQAPDLLRDVYESSLDSAGSAQAELDKYLESISGKIAKLQNQLQELAFVSFDSDFFKSLIDGATGALSVTTNLIDTFGTIPSIAAIASGVLSFKNVGSPKMYGLIEYADSNKCSYGYMSFLIA